MPTLRTTEKVNTFFCKKVYPGLLFSAIIPNASLMVAELIILANIKKEQLKNARTTKKQEERMTKNNYQPRLGSETEKLPPTPKALAVIFKVAHFAVLPITCATTAISLCLAVVAALLHGVSLMVAKIADSCSNTNNAPQMSPL